MAKNLAHLIVLTNFSNSLLAEPIDINNPMCDGLVLNNFKRYQDPLMMISNHIELEQLKKLCNTNSKGRHTTKRKKICMRHLEGRRSSAR